MAFLSLFFFSVIISTCLSETIIASESDQYEYGNITCNGTAECDVQCTNCYGTKITCPYDDDCDIVCPIDDACTYTSISCPSNVTNKTCTLHCNSPYSCINTNLLISPSTLSRFICIGYCADIDVLYIQVPIIPSNSAHTNPGHTNEFNETKGEDENLKSRENTSWIIPLIAFMPVIILTILVIITLIICFCTKIGRSYRLKRYLEMHNESEIGHLSDIPISPFSTIPLFSPITPKARAQANKNEPLKHSQITLPHIIADENDDEDDLSIMDGGNVTLQQQIYDLIAKEQSTELIKLEMGKNESSILESDNAAIKNQEYNLIKQEKITILIKKFITNDNNERYQVVIGK